MPPDDKDEPLSIEELEVDAIFNEISPQLDEMDRQINDLRPDQGPAPRPAGGPPPSRPFGTKGQQEYKLRFDSDMLKSQAKEKASKVIEKSSPQVRKKLAEKIEQWRHPDYKGKSDKKDISNSQEFLSRNMQPQSKNDATPLDRSAKKSSEAKPMSMSMRFSTSLGYSQMQEKAKKSPGKQDKPREVDIEKDK